jgi:DNA-binding HxlR family transcriptional regulator
MAFPLSLYGTRHGAPDDANVAQRPLRQQVRNLHLLWTGASSDHAGDKRTKGEDMLRYGQFCPVAKTAEIFADRWTPLIVRELCFGPSTFGELLFGMPLISRTMLAQRLKEMADAEVISITPKSQGRGNVYQLTPAGEDFRPLIELMSAWGQRWNQSVAPEELSPTLLMFGARRQIDLAALPAGRTVIRFDFRGVPKAKARERYWWLVIQRPEPEVCLKNPGFEVDAVVTADLSAFTRMVLGYLGLQEALGRGLVAFSGSEAAIALLCRLLQLPQQPVRKTFRFAPSSAPSLVALQGSAAA